ncbi:MAG: 2,3-bisphosphoglycerate-independent phosphoglycerate mutase [Candidatus Aenigmarchaeota archaeon]|nr:2,3-bisphosphoglycerate-independent phosphoglycerate mutase [Candidatus Aenigmarchaeota archaeon]
MKNKVILLIADGWGIAPDGPGNYITKSKTLVFDRLLEKYPHCQNQAAGNAVGLPEGTQGNSEVGHLHMGAGRIIWQPFEIINRSIENKSFFKNKTFKDLIKKVKRNKSTLHITGLCSDEGVHAHVNHLFALLELCKKYNLKEVFIHFIADGRDVPEKSAKKYIGMIENKCSELGLGKIATVIGRYYSMDRDNNWDRTKGAYDMLTKAEGFEAKSATEAVKMAYERGDKTDYYIQPTVIVNENGEPLAKIQDNDGFLFFNFRTDRPRQLTMAFIQDDFDKFNRDVHPKVDFVTMTEYSKSFGSINAFEKVQINNTLGKVLSENRLKQLRLAETEKYGHVTYFFNCQYEDPFMGEERLMIPSTKVPSYDLKPEMSAHEITEEAKKQISSRKFDFILINFANCDLVGHTANKKAIIKGVEVVDECTGKVIDVALKNDYVVVLTADHGSAEEKLYPNGKPKPAHSANPVNFFIITDSPELKGIKLKDGGQKDVAPTILDIMGIEKPKEMTGESLIQ